jgi:serine/threonine protein phosphatase PrpC
LATTTYPTSTPDVTLRYAGASDVGCRREKNEDAIGFVASDAPERSFLLIVADGVGGSAAGEVASQTAVETIEREVFRDGEPDVPGSALRAAVTAANRAIFQAAEANPLYAGMATTCTAAFIRGAKLNLAHVGDCRAYLAADGRLVQMTQDHSVGAEYVRQGRPLPPEKQNLANVLSRWLGSPDDVNVDVYEDLELAIGATLVLCSDGLTKVVSDDEILHTVSMHLPEGACRRLIELARERGGPDNISVHIACLNRE